MKKFLVIGALLLLALLATSVGAAPRRTQTGAIPLYDSGWVLTTTGYQTFTHNLNAFPTNISVFVADDDEGSYPDQVFDLVYLNNYDMFGGNVRDVRCNTILINWLQDGIAYSSTLAKWYQAGTDYARVLVFSADTEFGGPPCRP